MSHTIQPFNNDLGRGPNGMMQYQAQCVYAPGDFVRCTYYTTPQEDGVVCDFATRGSANLHIKDVIALRDELNKVIAAQENTHD